MEVEGHQITMEIDTGAVYSLVSEKTFQQKWPQGELNKSEIRLISYSGEAIEVMGSWEVSVKYKGQVVRLTLLVVKGEGLSLFRRN